jgi:minor extracellular protease Epr
MILRRNVKVINLSIAGPDNDVLQAVVEDAAASGSVLVSAAGNAGPSAPPAYPAAYDNVIAVTAVSDTLSVYRRAGRGLHIDIAAPGVRIKTAGKKNNLGIFTGSSFAVPFVTAAVAVQLSQNAGWKVNTAMDALKSSAKDLGVPGVDPVFGAGLLQFSACK